MWSSHSKTKRKPIHFETDVWNTPTSLQTAFFQWCSCAEAGQLLSLVPVAPALQQSWLPHNQLHQDTSSCTSYSWRLPAVAQPTLPRHVKTHFPPPDMSSLLDKERYNHDRVLSLIIHISLKRCQKSTKDIHQWNSGDRFSKLESTSTANGNLACANMAG